MRGVLYILTFLSALVLCAAASAEDFSTPPEQVVTPQLQHQIEGFPDDICQLVQSLTAKTRCDGPFDAATLNNLACALGRTDSADAQDQALLQSARDFAVGKISDDEFAAQLPGQLARFSGRAAQRLTPKATAGDVQATPGLR